MPSSPMPTVPSTPSIGSGASSRGGRWRRTAIWLVLAPGVVAGLAIGLTAPALADQSLPAIPSLSRALRIASGATSHTLCAGVFISGLPAEQVWQQETRPEPGMGLVAWLMDHQVDLAAREVRSTVAGGVARRAVFRDGLGCLLLAPGAEPPPAAPANDTTPPPDPDGDTPRPPPDPRLQQVLATAFAEDDGPPLRRTQAVVLLHRGRLLAERYAPGIGVNTALSGHSLSKSVTQALIGALVLQGRLDADAPAPVPEWQAPGDARQAITPEQLMRMSSGLPADETAGGFDAATRMWFDEPDMAGFAAQGRPEHPPGTVWHYANRGTMLLSRLVRDAVAPAAPGSPPAADGTARALAVRQWAQQALFQPAGMRRVTVGFDATGTPVGSSDIYATARDWARFGQLYLDDGVASAAPGGPRRLLPAGWVQRARTPTLDAGYGAGFWLNHTDARNEWGGRWGLPGAPADAFFGRGHLGQYVVVVPSRQLVVVRLGLTHRPADDLARVGRLVAEVVQVVDAAAGGPAQ